MGSQEGLLKLQSWRASTKHPDITVPWQGSKDHVSVRILHQGSEALFHVSYGQSLRQAHRTWILLKDFGSAHNVIPM